MAQFHTFSKKMQKVNQMITRTAGIDTAVLIIGEKGVGKTVCAKRIHSSSSRAACNFIEIAAESLYCESGKSRCLSDFFFNVDGGTLFIDEVGALKSSEQQELLEILKSGKSDFRLITSSTKPLEHSAKKGIFCEELLKNISVVQIRLPALRDRKEDIPYIVDHFMQSLNQELGCVKKLSSDVFILLNTKPWPGNILELENILEYAYKKCDGELVNLRDLPPWVKPGGYSSESGESLHDELFRIASELLQSADQTDTYVAMNEYLKLVMPPIIKAAVAVTSNNKTKSSELLGINRNTFKKYIREYQIEK